MSNTLLSSIRKLIEKSRIEGRETRMDMRMCFRIRLDGYAGFVLEGGIREEKYGGMEGRSGVVWEGVCVGWSNSLV